MEMWIPGDRLGYRRVYKRPCTEEPEEFFIRHSSLVIRKSFVEVSDSKIRTKSVTVEEKPVVVQ
jgi:hypothetical protein